VEHRHPAGLLQPLPILEWKWDTISMEFIIGLSKSTKQNDAIIIVVDKLSKVSHFIPVKSTCKEIDISNIFMKYIFKLHGMPKKIISERDKKITSNFWKYLFSRFETKFIFGTSYHPQTNEQTERVNQVLEDMLRMHVMHHPRKWEDYLPLVGFSYNNDYHEALNMRPLEVLYRRQCNNPINQNNLVEKITLGTKILK
jgi:hypothetical protein